MDASDRIKWLLFFGVGLLLIDGCLNLDDNLFGASCPDYEGCKIGLWVYDISTGQGSRVLEEDGCYSWDRGSVSVISTDSVLFDNDTIYDLNTGKPTVLPVRGSLSLDHQNLTFIKNTDQSFSFPNNNPLNLTTKTEIGVYSIHDQRERIVWSDSLSQTDSTISSTRFDNTFLLNHEKLVFAEYRQTYIKETGKFKSHDIGLYLMNLKDNSIKRINDAGSLFYEFVTISNDGNKILYNQVANGHELYYIYDVTTESRHQLNDTYYQPTFTPDDNNLLFVKDDKLWITTTDEQHKMQLSKDTERVRAFTISDDGKSVAYSYYTSKNGLEIVLLNLKNQQNNVIVSWKDHQINYFTLDEFNSMQFLPSGNKLAYTFKGSVFIPCP